MSAESAPPRSDARALLALLAIGLVGFTPTLLEYHVIWTAQPYTHGYLIAAATLWLLYRERSSLTSLDPWAPLPALAAVALVVLWLLGSIMGVRVFTLAALPTLVLVWALSAFGRRSIPTLIPIGLTFLIAVPIWEALIQPLRLMTVTATSALLRLTGIRAVIEESTVHITYGSFLIADDCSGFGFFMSGLAVGSLYAVAFVRRLPTRLAIIAASLTLAILGNWIRVTSLILIGHYTEMQAELIYDHGTFGWGIFFVGLVAFFPLARLIERRAATRWPEPSSSSEPAPERTARGLQPVVLTTVPMVVAPALLFTLAALPARDVEEPAVAGSVSVVSGEARPYEWIPGYVGTDAVVSGLAVSDPAVVVDRFIYESQEPDAELIGFYNEIAPADLIVAARMIGPIDGTTAYVNEAAVREGDRLVLVWYWYRVGGTDTASSIKAKLLEIPALVTRKRRAELIAVSTMCEPAGCEGAAGRLQAFLARH